MTVRCLFLNQTAHTSNQKNNLCPSTSSQLSPQVASHSTQPCSGTLKLSTPLESGHKITVEGVDRPHECGLDILDNTKSVCILCRKVQRFFGVSNIGLVAFSKERPSRVRDLSRFQDRWIEIVHPCSFLPEITVGNKLQSVHRHHRLDPVILLTDIIPDLDRLDSISQCWRCYNLCSIETQALA